jgi:excinuclease ABC subunit C
MNDKDFIKNKIREIPELPGIYKMLDFRGNIIYIGKSKCLKKRVQSYFVSSPKWEKVKRMVLMIRDIEYVVTDTHLEARLLECSLIKDYQPRFNAQMKNDKSYFFIKVDQYNPFHALSVVAEREEDCFGPFRSKYKISEFISSLKNIYPITKGSKCYNFEYRMFPISMDKETFALNRKILLELFSDEDNIDTLVTAFRLKIEKAAAEYRYEMASIYRDMMITFNHIKNGLNRYKSLSSRNIVLKLPLSSGYKLFFVSKGCLIHNMIATELTETTIQDFKDESITKLLDYPTTSENEKSYLDYRDVLYSEISNLSEDMYELL